FFRALTDPKREGNDARTIRIFCRGDYYTVHGREAERVADHVFKSRSVMRVWRGNAAKRQAETTDGLPTVCVSKVLFEQCLKVMLLERRCPVELYEKKAGKGWFREAAASPGDPTAFADVLGDDCIVDSPAVVYVSVTEHSGISRVALSYVDTVSSRIGAVEFDDSPHLSLLSSYLVQLSAADIRHGPSPTPALARLLTTVDLPHRPIEASTKALGGWTAVGQLCGWGGETGRLEEQRAREGLTEASQKGLGALVQALGLGNAESTGAYHWVPPSSSYMLLTHSDAQTLGVFDAAAVGAAKGSATSLYKVLNKTLTPMGSRLLSAYLRHPLIDKTEILRRQGVVGALVSDGYGRAALRDDCLKLVPNLDYLFRKLARGKPTLRDLVKLYFFCVRLPTLVSAAQPLDDGSYATRLSEIQTKVGNFVALVETTVDLDALLQHEYRILPSFDAELASLDGEMRELRDGLEGELEAAARKLGPKVGKHVRLGSTTTQGYFLRVPRSGSAAVNKAKGYSVIESRAQGIKFSSVKLRQLSQQLTSLEAEYSAAQGAIEAKVFDVACSFATPFREASVVVAELDVLAAFAHVSVQQSPQWVCPRVSDASGCLHLSQCRHALLDAMPDETGLVPNDVKLGERDPMDEPVFDNEGAEAPPRFVYITGPNMGGKTTYLKAAGLVTVLAQVGCYVPCEAALVGIRDRVAVRAGAGDSLLKGLSTFMAEMLDIAGILEAANPRSLVLVDELGRGTSVFDGFGLAWAVAEDLVQRAGSLVLFATHIHELTLMGKGETKVGNVHAEAEYEDGQLHLTYKFPEGASSRSFGLEVAKMAGFPQCVLDDAQSLVHGGQGSMVVGPNLDEATVAEAAQQIGLARIAHEEWVRQGRPEADKERVRQGLEAAIANYDTTVGVAEGLGADQS
ncbi:DNA mismatch repair protein Msh2, partial [Kipferlia bialata]